MSRASFNKLQGEVYAEYRTKGYSVADSLEISQKVAGMVANRHRGMKINRRRVRKTTRVRH